MLNDQFPEPKSYQFTAKPRVMQPIAKYRQTGQDENKTLASLKIENLMFDRRVIRGSTYTMNLGKEKDGARIQKKLRKDQNEEGSTFQKATPVDYSKYDIGKDFTSNDPKIIMSSMQTEDYVETISERNPENHVEIQTDFYIDRPMNRLFVAKKYGVDSHTEMTVGDLFDFDEEVEPLLQVLVYKTLEASRMEVLEEEELAQMKRQLKIFEEKRNSELAEVQRMQAQDGRVLEEKDRRELQHWVFSLLKTYFEKKSIARRISRSCLRNLQKNAFSALDDHGYFRLEQVDQFHSSFMPWLLNDVKSVLGKAVEMRKQMEFETPPRQPYIDAHIASKAEMVQKLKNRENEKIRKEEEKLQLKKQRQDQKRKEEALRLRNILQNKLKEEFIDKAESVQNLFAFPIKSIDLRSVEKENSVYLLKSGLHELLMFLLAVDQVLADNENSEYKEKMGMDEKIRRMLDSALESVLKESRIEFFISDDQVDDLKQLIPQPDLKVLAPFTVGDIKERFVEIMMQIFDSNTSPHSFLYGATGRMLIRLLLSEKYITKIAFITKPTEKKNLGLFIINDDEIKEIQESSFLLSYIDSLTNFKALTNAGKIYSQRNDSTCVQVYSIRTQFVFWKELYNSFVASDRNFEANIGEKLLPFLIKHSKDITNYLKSFDSEYSPVFEL